MRHPPQVTISQPSPGTAQESYSGGSLTPSQLLRELHPRLAGEHGSFVVLGTLEDLLRRTECVCYTRLDALIAGWAAASRMQQTCRTHGGSVLR